jgi:GTP1/Obg family GTP-binding protein
MSVDPRDPPDPVPSSNKIIASALENARQAATRAANEVPEPFQRQMSNLLTSVQQLATALEKAERENRKAQPLAAEAERAIAAAEKAEEKLQAAESARNAAERIAERERFDRISAEDERDELLASLRAASQQKSRLDRVIDQHGV